MLVPPWERYDDGPTSLRWRMGGGEELIEEWLALWWRQSNDERLAYLSAHPPPAEWKQWLSVVALGGPPLRWPKKTKYSSQVSRYGGARSARRFVLRGLLARGQLVPPELSIEKLKEILGHYSVVMTERYAHLKPELFTPKDMAVIDLGLVAGPADSPTPLVGRRV